MAARTASAAVGSFLIQTDGTSPATVARRIERVVGAGARVTNIVDQRQVIGSNLTAIELSGLTRIEPPRWGRGRDSSVARSRWLTSSPASSIRLPRR